MNDKTESGIGPKTVLARSGELLEAEIDGDKVMMSIEQGEYYGLDSTGSEIWELLAEPRSVAEICAEMLTRYEVSAEECERDVKVFLGDLLSDGILEAVEPAE